MVATERVALLHPERETDRGLGEPRRSPATTEDRWSTSALRSENRGHDGKRPRVTSTDI